MLKALRINRTKVECKFDYGVIPGTSKPTVLIELKQNVNS